jgi:hypothetical protein
MRTRHRRVRTTTRYQKYSINAQTKRCEATSQTNPSQGTVPTARLQSYDQEQKKSYDLLRSFLRHVNHHIGKTRDESGGNQVVSRVIADMQACMKASIMTHLGLCLPSAQAAEPSKAPAPKEPFQELRQTQDTTRRPKDSPPAASPATPAQTDGPPGLAPPVKVTNPKSWAELVRGATPKDLPKRPGRPLSNKRPYRTNRVFVRLPEDSALRTVHLLFVVETASPVRTGITLTPKSGTTTDDLLHTE